MNRLRWLIIAFPLIGWAIVGGALLYLNKQWSPILSDPKLLVIPTRFHPPPTQLGAYHDLGYARFYAPAELDLVLGDDYAPPVFVLHRRSDPTATFAWLRPIQAQTTETADLTAALRKLGVACNDDYFSLTKALLEQKPESLISLLLHHRQHLSEKLSFLLAKQISVADATDIQIYETNHLGIIYASAETGGHLMIYHKKTNLLLVAVSQFSTDTTSKLLSALIQSLEVRPEWEDALIAQDAQRDLSEPNLEANDERARLEAVRQEVLRRRS